MTPSPVHALSLASIPRPSKRATALAAVMASPPRSAAPVLSISPSGSSSWSSMASSPATPSQPASLASPIDLEFDLAKGCWTSPKRPKTRKAPLPPAPGSPPFELSNPFARADGLLLAANQELRQEGTSAFNAGSTKCKDETGGRKRKLEATESELEQEKAKAPKLE